MLSPGLLNDGNGVVCIVLDRDERVVHLPHPGVHDLLDVQVIVLPARFKTRFFSFFSGSLFCESKPGFRPRVLPQSGGQTRRQSRRRQTGDPLGTCEAHCLHLKEQ